MAMTDSPKAQALRDSLKQCGSQRSELDAEDLALTEEIKRLVKESKGVLSKEEVATLLGMHRTTVYRVYV